ncbi:sugar transferase [Desulfosporosinus sp.]|uniref:sugar transferase n=1 Tax=Desulfosporosinus sp. TaxID=157907 RepID=UPI0025B92069|nr:sugar transferase [Desulfosporosinus sp.]MBC2722198.1 sugar transferase [Desulfosporosinus sp.]MBC2726052.1 sugar transferase [Desulfosporosinus sp.]
MKRCTDVLFGFLLLIILSPLLIIIALVIKLDSKGPALFCQKRIGRNNREFVFYKFRSMRTETPDVATHLLKDPQSFITPVGKFLRKSSLDELPQLLNIIKGDMTFIGPRPALYNQYDLIEMRTKCGVHTLRPGVSGWAQVNGRDCLELSEKVDYDLYYLEHHNVALDIKILFFTALKVLKADGIREGARNPEMVERRESSM